MAALLYAVATLLLCVSLGLAFHAARQLQRRHHMRRRLQLVLHNATERHRPRDEAGRSEGPLVKLGALWLRTRGADREIARLLAQAGWHRQQDLALFYGIQTALPAFASGAALIAGFALLPDGSLLALLWLGLGSFAAAFLGPRWLLRADAARRRRRVRDEVQMLAQLLKVLFEAGLALDQALLTVTTDHGDMVPELVRELRPVLRQIRRGRDRSETLAEMAEALDVADLTHLVTLLRQVDRYGGNIQQPLRSFLDLLDDHRRTEVQERVGKLSGSMTVVMVACLFPALLVFLAGPGFLAILRMLTGMGD